MLTAGGERPSVPEEEEQENAAAIVTPDPPLIPLSVSRNGGFLVPTLPPAQNRESHKWLHSETDRTKFPLFFGNKICVFASANVSKPLSPWLLGIL